MKIEARIMYVRSTDKTYSYIGYPEFDDQKPSIRTVYIEKIAIPPSDDPNIPPSLRGPKYIRGKVTVEFPDPPEGSGE